MSWWQRLWGRRVESDQDGGGREAAAHLEQLEMREPEIQQLGHELREIRRRNNFSGMVDRAIARRAHHEGS